MSRLQDVILRGLAGSQPVATSVPNGTLYYSTDSGILERSNGTTWEAYSSAAGGPPAPHASSHFTIGSDPIPIEDIGGLVQEIIVKPSDESVANNTLQNDNDFVKAILANETWVISGVLFVTGSTTGEFNWAFNAPTGATGWNSGIRLSTVATTPNEAVNLSAIEDITDTGFRSGGTVGTSTPVLFRVEAIVINGANAGNIQFRWAQLVTDAGNPTVIHSGSYMMFTRKQ